MAFVDREEIMTCACGAYANASVTGKNGGRVPVCDSCISTEPDAVYRLGSYPHVTRDAGLNIAGLAKQSRRYVRAKDVVTTAPESVGTRDPEAVHVISQRSLSFGGQVLHHQSSVDSRVQTVTLVLGEPPSANRWWRTNRGRVHRSHEATDYMAMLRERAAIQATLFPAPVLLSVIIVWRRERKAGDLDKRLGVLLDAMQTWEDKKGLVHPGVYDNDSQVVQIWARRCDEHPTLQPGTVRVEVSAI